MSAAGVWVERRYDRTLKKRREVGWEHGPARSGLRFLSHSYPSLAGSRTRSSKKSGADSNFLDRSCKGHPEKVLQVQNTVKQIQSNLFGVRSTLTTILSRTEPGELNAPRGTCKEGERGMNTSRSSIRLSFPYSRIRQRQELFPSRKCDVHSFGPTQKLALVAGRSKSLSRQG